ncbi:uncharacterized protein BDW47DRAFT_82823 [Aspergillus candidus]|uniref:Secreted protein n=1 Tax=Aspergillus candidus TaxID=41067 RepID=A0A2I2FJM1_ASPCN|nr:hypothetical protein BDW47DRAFT_82823 [Aspergillus candidus]PLB40826.1 hypothetical protein BDW47DRAFT_82823 [Aspergillus candidus]
MLFTLFFHVLCFPPRSCLSRAVSNFGTFGAQMMTGEETRLNQSINQPKGMMGSRDLAHRAFCVCLLRMTYDGCHHRMKSWRK